jgi:chromosome segregation ATPase
MKKEKTIHELSKEFPNKTYVELEKYRDADRNEEAQQISLSESQQKQEELEPIEGAEQDNPELFEWKEKYNKEHKLRQEAETETTLVKGIGMNSPEMKAANKKIEELQGGLERARKENNDLFNRIAEALAVNESHQKMNGKLQERLTELEEENKRMHNHLNKQVENARKSGM